MAGILAFLFLLVSTFAASGTPSGNPTVVQITHYLTSHRNAVLAQTVLTVIGSAFTLWFAGTLARLLHVRDRHSPLGMIVLASGAGLAVISTLDGLTLTALEFLSKQGGLTDPSLTRAFYDLQNGIIMPGAFGCIAAIFLTAVGVALLRRRFGARWLGWLSVVLAVFAVIGSVLGLTLTDPTVFGFLPAIGSLLVVLISSIFMVRDRGDGTVAVPRETVASL